MISLQENKNTSKEQINVSYFFKPYVVLMSLYITEEMKIYFNHYEINAHQIPFQFCVLFLNSASDQVAGKVTSGMIMG